MKFSLIQKGKSMKRKKRESLVNEIESRRNSYMKNDEDPLSSRWKGKQHRAVPLESVRFVQIVEKSSSNKTLTWASITQILSIINPSLMLTTYEFSLKYLQHLKYVKFEWAEHISTCTLILFFITSRSFMELIIIWFFIFSRRQHQISRIYFQVGNLISQSFLYCVTSTCEQSNWSSHVLFGKRVLASMWWQI